METTRFDSRVVQNLRVTGSLDNNGKQTVIKRCWATFKTSENTSTTPNATPATGHRGSFTPMRIFDYETKKGFLPPPNATIVAVSVLGKTAADHDKLCSMRVSLGNVPTANGFAIGVMRAPDSDADTVASRDCVSNVLTGFTGNVPNLVKLSARSAGLKDVFTTNGDFCNPYDGYYKYLSPNQTVPALFNVNKQVGVCQEFAELTLMQYTGALRIPWGAPPATVNNGKNVNDVVANNQGLSLFITQQNNHATGQFDNTRQITLLATADITFDVLVELEFDENTDLASDSAIAFSNLDLQAQTM
jgi:hypothetical protein